MSDLENVLSAERLARYPGTTLAEKLVLYRWNVELCQSLYPTFHYLEVALRNRMHAAFTDFRGTPWWFEDRDFIQHRYAVKAVKDARRKVQGREVLPGDIVAGVTFGFWRGMFHEQFETAWRAVAREVFPKAPVRFSKRKELNRRIDIVLRFRNRVFHHEPVFHWRDLVEKHTTMRDLLGWMSPEAEAELERLDTFAATFADDPRLIG